jgi:hypothetical protein
VVMWVNVVAAEIASEQRGLEPKLESAGKSY